MGLKSILPMLAAAEMMMPAPEVMKINSPAINGFTRKQWEKRKKKIKQQRLSRKINRKRSL